jgi:hypothetical protein
VCHQFGLGEPSGADLHRLVTAWHRLDPWPDAVAGLTRLKSKFIIAPCSNGNIALITNMAKRAGLPWDVVLGAEVAQAYKPDPQAYLGSADALGLKPEECMMVAAHQDDLDAAAELGMATAYVLRPDEFGPDVTIEPTREERVDACGGQLYAAGGPDGLLSPHAFLSSTNSSHALRSDFLVFLLHPKTVVCTCKASACRINGYEVGITGDDTHVADLMAQHIHHGVQHHGHVCRVGLPVGSGETTGLNAFRAPPSSLCTDASSPRTRNCDDDHPAT